MQIRRARVDDIPAIVMMQQEGWFGDYAGYIPAGYAADQHAIFAAPEAIQRNIAEYDVYSVVEDAGRVIGAACAGRLSEDEAELWWIHVLRRDRGRGIGRLLVDAVVEQLPERVATLYVTTFQGYAPTIAFYKRLGFVEHSTAATDWRDVAVGDVRLRLDLAGRRSFTPLASHPD